MLHRVSMDIIDMPVEVGLIADEMFPKSMLPSRALVPVSATRVHPFIHSGRLSLVWQRCITIRLTTRERWEKSSSPGGNIQRACMRSGSNTKPRTDGSNEPLRSLPAGPSAHRYREERLAPIGIDGEEIAATRQMGATVIRHDGIIPPKNGAPRTLMGWTPPSTLRHPTLRHRDVPR